MHSLTRCSTLILTLASSDLNKPFLNDWTGQYVSIWAIRAKLLSRCCKRSGLLVWTILFSWRRSLLQKFHRRWYLGNVSQYLASVCLGIALRRLLIMDLVSRLECHNYRSHNSILNLCSHFRWRLKHLRWSRCKWWTNWDSNMWLRALWRTSCRH